MSRGFFHDVQMLALRPSRVSWSYRGVQLVLMRKVIRLLFCETWQETVAGVKISHILGDLTSRFCHNAQLVVLRYAASWVALLRDFVMKCKLMILRQTITPHKVGGKPNCLYHIYHGNMCRVQEGGARREKLFVTRNQRPAKKHVTREGCDSCSSDQTCRLEN